METHGIGWAVKQMRGGYRVHREGWNGKGMWLCLWPGHPGGVGLDAVDAKAMGLPEGSTQRFEPYVMMRTVQGNFIPWPCSQADLLADDWEITYEI